MNSVNISGILKEGLDEFHRYFEYTLPFFQEGNVAIPRIIVKNWTNQPGARLIALPDNTRVLIHGHLDGHDKFGTILLVEQLEVVK